MTLPKTVAVRIENDGDTPWLNAEKSASDFAVVGEKFTVGIYDLVQVVEVTAEAKFKLQEKKK